MPKCHCHRRCCRVYILLPPMETLSELLPPEELPGAVQNRIIVQNNTLQTVPVKITSNGTILLDQSLLPYNGLSYNVPSGVVATNIMINSDSIELIKDFPCQVVMYNGTISISRC